jgi:hypothetical protein
MSKDVKHANLIIKQMMGIHNKIEIKFNDNGTINFNFDNSLEVLKVVAVLESLHIDLLSKLVSKVHSENLENETLQNELMTSLKLKDLH